MNPTKADRKHLSSLDRCYRLGEKAHARLVALRWVEIVEWRGMQEGRITPAGREELERWRAQGNK